MSRSTRDLTCGSARVSPTVQPERSGLPRGTSCLPTHLATASGPVQALPAVQARAPISVGTQALTRGLLQPRGDSSRSWAPEPDLRLRRQDAAELHRADTDTRCSHPRHQHRILPSGVRCPPSSWLPCPRPRDSSSLTTADGRGLGLVLARSVVTTHIRDLSCPPAVTVGVGVPPAVCQAPGTRG